jgi:hypothetical protein
MRTSPEPKALRITDQVRTRRGYSYDLAVEGRRLTLLIEPTQDDDAWRIEARGREKLRGVEHNVAAEGGSRCEALRALSDRWADHGGPTIDFDWRAVEELLTQVRAL